MVAIYLILNLCLAKVDFVIQSHPIQHISQPIQVHFSLKNQGDQAIDISNHLYQAKKLLINGVPVPAKTQYHNKKTEALCVCGRRRSSFYLLKTQYH